MSQRIRMFGLLPHRCLLRCEDAGTSYRTGDRTGFDSIRLLMASFVRRYHLHFLCFISLLLSLFVYFLLSLLLFLFLLLLLLLLAEGGVKVGRDMHSNSSATQCQRQRQRHRQRQRSHRHLRQRHINAQRATRRANFNFSCSSISTSNSNFNCHCDCDLKSDFHLKSRPGRDTWPGCSWGSQRTLLPRVAKRDSAASEAHFCHANVHVACCRPESRAEQPQGDGYQQIDPHVVRKYNSKLEQFISNHFIAFQQPARDHKEAAGQRNLQRAQTDWRLDGWDRMHGRYNCSASTWSLQNETRRSLGKLGLRGKLLNIYSFKRLRRFVGNVMIITKKYNPTLTNLFLLFPIRIH